MKKHVLQISLKDIQGNLKPFVMLLMALAATGIFLPATQRKYLGEGAQLVFLANLNLVNILATAQWVFANEKQRKTITILKSLPVSARDILLGKFLAAFLLSETIFLASFGSLQSSVAWRFGLPVFASIYELVLFNLLVLMSMFVFSASAVIFEPKTSTVLPLVALLALILIAIGLGKLGLGRNLFTRVAASPYLAALLTVGSMLIIFLCFFASEQFLDKTEPSELTAE